MAVANAPSAQLCAICKTSYYDPPMIGPWQQTDGINVHYHCLLLATDCPQNGQDSEGIYGFLAADIREAIRKAENRMCTKCEQPGAAIKCAVPRCKRNYHLPCGLTAGFMPQYTGEFHSYCPLHLPLSKNEKKPGPNDGCVICHNLFTLTGRAYRIPTCCKNIWFHRKCMQRYAYSFGYKVKCVACDVASEEYRELLRKRGVFVPDADTFHAVEEEIRVELTQKRCRATACWCTEPSGRTYIEHDPNSNWLMMSCVTCGSCAHKACDVKRNQQYKCNECTDTEHILNVQSVDGGGDNSNRPSNKRPMSPLTEDDIRIRRQLKPLRDQISLASDDPELWVRVFRLSMDIAAADCAERKRLRDQEAAHASTVSDDLTQQQVSPDEPTQIDESEPLQVPLVSSQAITISDSSNNSDHIFNSMSQQPVRVTQQVDGGLENVSGYHAKHEELKKIRYEEIMEKRFLVAIQRSIDYKSSQKQDE